MTMKNSGKTLGLLFGLAFAAIGLTYDQTLAKQADGLSLERRILQLEDRQQIHDVYIRYIRGFDRNDVALMKTAFWPEVQINYGRQSNTFDEFVHRHLKSHTGKLTHYAHLITTESVEISGDVAHVETHVIRFSNDNPNRSMLLAGRYIDRLDRRHGEWRIAVREFIPYFAGYVDSSIDAYLGANVRDGYSSSACGYGTWDKRDPSYTRPLNPRTEKNVGPTCSLSEPLNPEGSKQ